MPHAHDQDQPGNQAPRIGANPRGHRIRPGALSDIPAWAKDMGHALKEQFEENDEFHFIVEKG